MPQSFYDGWEELDRDAKYGFVKPGFIICMGCYGAGVIRLMVEATVKP